MIVKYLMGFHILCHKYKPRYWFSDLQQTPVDMIIVIITVLLTGIDITYYASSSLTDILYHYTNGFGTDTFSGILMMWAWKSLNFTPCNGISSVGNFQLSLPCYWCVPECKNILCWYAFCRYKLIHIVYPT